MRDIYYKPTNIGGELPLDKVIEDGWKGGQINEGVITIVSQGESASWWVNGINAILNTIGVNGGREFFVVYQEGEFLTMGVGTVKDALRKAHTKR